MVRPASEQEQAPLPQALHQWLGRPLISKYLAPESGDHALQHLAVVGIAPCDLEGHDLALMVNDQVELDAKETSPGRCGPVTSGRGTSCSG